jgi:hypothetical protein
MKLRVRSETTEKAVMVTTKHRGVFFGYTVDDSGETIHLRAARMCIYWSADLRGVLGLASVGPNSNCRISPPADLQLRDVTAVVTVTPQAVKRREEAPWRA